MPTPQVPGTSAGPETTGEPVSRPSNRGSPPTTLLRRLSDRTPPLVIGAFLLMAISMLFSTPPGAWPDEAAHYLRALGAGRGQLVLDDVPPKPPAPQFAAQIEWMQMQSGQVRVPEKLGPAAFECWGFPFYVGTCEEADPPTSDKPAVFETYVGTYPPSAYLLPGLLMRATDEPVTALMLGRAGILVVSLLLLAVAVLALYEKGKPLWLVGVVCTVSPMVVAMGASLSSSGVEIAASICFLACLLRLSRSEGPGWVWLGAAAGGAALAVTRDLGPAWVALDLGLVAVFNGFGPLWSVWRAGGRRAWIFAAVIGTSVAGALAWRATEAVEPDLSRLRFPVVNLEVIGGWVRQVVGVFGPLDALMPEPAYQVWGAMVLILVVTALFSGNLWRKTALVLSILVTAVAALALEAVQNIYNFGVQARHIMPAAVCVTLLAGEAVARGPRPRWASSRFVVPLLAIAAAGVHLTAWYTVGRRFSMEYAPPIFFTRPVWSPPGGWIVWGLLTAAASAALVLPFLASAGREREISA